MLLVFQSNLTLPSRSNPMHRKTYKDIRNELAIANEWLASLGLPERVDRIRQHMKHVEQLDEAWQAGKLVEATRGEDGRLAVFSLTEAMEFLAVYRAFAQCHPAELLDRIKEALDGPADLHDESDRTNRGRNVMFELNLASHLRSQGMPVALPVNPDVLTQLEKVPLYIQCKRPFRQETIPDNIHIAEKQLTKDLDGASNADARGIIAISVSRVFNPGNQLYTGRELKGLIESLANQVKQLGNAHQKTWADIKDPRIIAILCHLITPAFIENVGLITVAQHILVFRLPSRSQADIDLLRKLEDILNTGQKTM